MSQNKNGPAYRELASQYDKEVNAYSSYGHEAVFGMCFEFVNAEENLLDIGIGTGLASIHFSKVGLKVSGLDSSQEMLATCQSKSFAGELKQCDITRESIPYANQYFNHVICCGVLHFIEDVSVLFSEVKRVIKSGGIFAFTIAPHGKSAEYCKEPTAWGVPIFKHAPSYITAQLGINKMALLKEQRLLMKGADKINFDMLFSVLICKCGEK